jgi:hypothetical protein
VDLGTRARRTHLRTRARRTHLRTRDTVNTPGKPGTADTQSGVFRSSHRDMPSGTPRQACSYTFEITPENEKIKCSIFYFLLKINQIYTFASVWGDVCLFGSSKSRAYHENIYSNYQSTTEINKILNVISLDPVLSIVIINIAYPYKHSMFANNQLFMISRGPLYTVPDIYNIKFLARSGIWRSFAKNLNLSVQTEKKE